MSQPSLIVALVGNPNTGKSTLFNALSGLRQHVGNYPGVTVEMKKGHFYLGEQRVDLIDLPGTYSLSARSPDEMVAVDLLLGRRREEPRPHVILSIVDASNLDRHLYLTTQLMELGEPVVLAVNMVDVAEAQGVQVDCAALARETGLTVVPIRANRGVGLDRLQAALVQAAKTGTRPVPVPLPAAFEAESQALERELSGELPPFLAHRLILDVGGTIEQWVVDKHGPVVKQHIEAARVRLAEAGHPIPAAEARARYGWIREIVGKCVTRPSERPKTWTDRIDHVLTHRVWGTLFFLAVMFLVFQSIFVAAEPLMGLIEEGTSWLADQFQAQIPEGPLQSLICDGVIAGVGGVLVFLPQIMILFAFIAVLEGCGYMARAAYLMDRLMSRCGLSGKSFIPLLSSVACAIPGVMATRVIENRRDRFATIVVAPLMSCSARLPVYLLLIGAFLTEGFAWWVPGLTLFGMYMIGFTLAPLVALLLKRTLLRGETPLFVMELPAYRLPSLRVILRRMVSAGWAFVYRAGTLILAATVLIWACLYFPTTSPDGTPYPERIAATADEAEQHSLQAEWKAHSLFGQLGHSLEPAFRPLGWDWKIGMATLASFPAREVIVGTLGIIYAQGEVDAGDADQRKQLGATLRADIARDPARGPYRVPVALSVMVFFALCCQCAATLAVIRRETRSWAWPAFTFTYMTTMAYVGAFLVYQLGRVLVDALGA
ncbi:MAG: ferrous iron transport protein B [Bacteroidales bacterium]|nr:ferrous iron transport protein B [Bacteroidales bacterium]